MNPVFLDESIEFYFNGVSARQAAPRLFCDICDEFDLHDTEDCPKQVREQCLVGYPKKTKFGYLYDADRNEVTFTNSGKVYQAVKVVRSQKNSRICMTKYHFIPRPSAS